MVAYEKDPLTKREQEIIRLLAKGLSDRQIAEQLIIAPETVRWYNKRIYSKLHVSNRTQAGHRAQELGLLEDESGQPGSAASRANHNLPAPVTPFIGRKRELGKLTNLLHDDGIRLVTVVAPGGMGKSRLALETARAQLGNFLHGVFYIPLEKISSPRHIVSAIAERLNHRFYTADDPEGQLLDYLSDKWLLLLFDGFEHLLEGRELIKEILTSAPGIKILVTSREQLNLGGEAVYHLGGMDFPEQASADDIIEYEAVELFIQSAQRAKPGYAPGPGALEEVVNICQGVHGMPLAIVLAAAWIQVLSPGEISREIRQNLDFLRTSAGDAPERQHSIRSVFDHSWGQLDEDVRTCFMKLSIFKGGFTREAARQIAGAELGHLATLASRSLLTHDPDIRRYEIHQLLRQYAAEQLDGSGLAHDVCSAHMDYFTNFLRSHEAGIKGPHQLQTLDRIEADFENVRQAWLWAVNQRDAYAINRSTDCLYWFCQIRGRVQDGQELIQEARAAFVDAPGHPVQRRLLIRFDASGDAYRAELMEALEGARADGESFEIALLLWALGVNGYVSHAFGRAIATLKEALDLFQELDDRFYLVEVLHLLGFCSRLHGNLDDAESYARRAMAIARTSGNKMALARALGAQAMFRIFQGDLVTAESQTREALAIRREMGDDSGVAMSKTSLGLIAMFRGNFDQARALAWEAKEIATTIRHPNSRETANNLLGWIASMEEDYETAWRLCQAARRNAPDPTVTHMAEMGLALAACGRQDYQAARDYLQKSQLSFDALGGARATLTCLPVAAVILTHEGSKKRAVELLALAFSLEEKADSWLEAWPLISRLRESLENELGDEAYTAAWERGLMLSIEATSQALAEM